MRLAVFVFAVSLGWALLMGAFLAGFYYIFRELPPPFDRALQRARVLRCRLFGCIRTIEPTAYGRELGAQPIRCLRCPRCDRPL